jgi:tRNA-specific 2-thiouridylase
MTSQINSHMNKAKIGIAMSGGVDSTACGLLLQKEYQVYGFFMQLAQPDFAEQLKRVQDVADKCGIPLQVIDLRARFEEKVLHYFATAYQNGTTPNPCMICNPEIKFGLFMDAIIAQGIEYIATGHYANIVRKNDCLYLQQGGDERKDQSYFLARLSQKQLAQVRFPLGHMDKEEVYHFVEEHGFHNFRGQESQDICFLGTESVGQFLENRQADPTTSIPGEIVSTNGEVLGHHTGIYNYTIGQRKGLGISAATPLYVTCIDSKNNRIIVGIDDDLLQNSIEIKDLLWNCDKEPDREKRYRVRIRYGHRGGEATLKHLPGKRCQILFTEKQRAVTPGQFAVIYDKDLVIGSGEII